MSNSYFRFKRFTVHQDKCAMKVGTDGVLLGAWSNVQTARRILDVGTGTGLVALMLAQRSDADIIAVEIDKDAVLQARLNVAASPWPDKINVIETDYLQYDPDCRFDVIVSNPPYFADSLLPPDKRRSLARHSNDLTYTGLLSHTSRLLLPGGRFVVVLPMDRSDEFIEVGQKVGLFPSGQLNIITAPGKHPKRTLLEFATDSQPYTIDELLIEEERHRYSPKFIQLMKDYYLKL